MKALYYVDTLREIDLNFNEDMVIELTRQVVTYEEAHPDMVFWKLDVEYDSVDRTYFIKPKFKKK